MSNKQVPIKKIGEYEVNDTVVHVDFPSLKLKIVDKDNDSVLLERIGGRFTGKRNSVSVDSEEYLPVGRTKQKEKQKVVFSRLMKTRKSKEKPSEDTYLTTGDVAKKAKTSLDYITEEVEKGKLIAKKVMSKDSNKIQGYLFKQEDVTEWLDKTRKQRSRIKKEIKKKNKSHNKKIFYTFDEVLRNYSVHRNILMKAIQNKEVKYVKLIQYESKYNRYGFTKEWLEEWMKKREENAQKSAVIPLDIDVKDQKFEVGGRPYVYYYLLKKHKDGITKGDLIKKAVEIRKEQFGVTEENERDVMIDVNHHMHRWKNNIGKIRVDIDDEGCKKDAIGRYRKGEANKVIFRLVGLNEDDSGYDNNSSDDVEERTE